MFLVPGLVSAAVGAAAGAFVPRLIARVPEPAPEPVEEHVVEDMRAAPDEADFARPLDEPKEPYVEVAALPGLWWKAALATAVLLGGVGARIGWHPVLLVFVYLVPVCVALTVIDWRTRLLPTWLIAPSYLVVAALCTLASLLTGDWHALLTAGIGWVSTFAVFFLLWFVYPRGMGYGDVRLSGVLGMALGWLGIGPLVIGMYAGFLVGALGGYLLALLRVFHRRHFPFGPFMALGAWLGVVFTAQLGAAFAGVVQGIAGLLS
ncbi:MAG: prepilin peptidase [Nocardioidaceae bacterium]|nr:prepilin peptidase [Nocardioidaceae bacterium]NUS52350.1 prepilin peptidase [Nocardioidaceae bacterium]